MDLLLLCLLGGERSLVLGESSSDGARLLGAEIERRVLLALVEQSELRTLVGVYDGEDASNALPDIMDAGELGGGSSGNFASPQADQFPSISVSTSVLPICSKIGNPRFQLLQLGAQILLRLVPQLGGLLRRL